MFFFPFQVTNLKVNVYYKRITIMVKHAGTRFFPSVNLHESSKMVLHKGAIIKLYIF